VRGSSDARAALLPRRGDVAGATHRPCPGSVYSRSWK